jgi:hypothetical protein
MNKFLQESMFLSIQNYLNHSLFKIINMDFQGAVLKCIELRGPVVPVDVAKYLGKDTLLANAIISELLNRGKIKTSFLQMGRSKLHYLPGQEDQLVRFSKYLNEKDLRTYDLLEKEEVLRDSDQNALIRISLRNIKDFAIPLEVNYHGKKELFWKWFLISNETASEKIKSILDITQEKLLEKEEYESILPSNSDSAPDLNINPIDVKNNNNNNNNTEKINKKEKLSVSSSKISNSDLRTYSNSEDKNTHSESSKPTEVEPNLNQKKERIPELNSENKTSSDVAFESNFEEIGDEFANEILNYFSKNEIKPLNYNIIRSKTDIDFEVLIPTVVGDLKYYCKARKKKTINDADLSQAYVSSIMRRLPCLFITTGTLTKKALEQIDSDLDMITVVNLD